MPRKKSSARTSPGPIQIMTAVEVSANAARRWREQYRDWKPGDTFADGTTKRSVDEALNKAKHTPANIARIINQSWSHPQCSCCRTYRDAVAVFGQPWGGDEETLVCRACLDAARDALAASGWP